MQTSFQKVTRFLCFRKYPSSILDPQSTDSPPEEGLLLIPVSMVEEGNGVGMGKGFLEWLAGSGAQSPSR